VQAQVVGLDHNQLTGTIPKFPNISLLNATSNSLSSTALVNLPASLKVAYLANNSFNTTFPEPDQLPANLTVLDVSNNLLSGPLPQALPANLIVLNASANALNGSLPGDWPRLAELRLDDTAVTGGLPAAWHQWGSDTSNSIQLSLVDNHLRGQVPSQWVQQFCLAVTQESNEQVLFQPSQLDLVFDLGRIAHASREEHALVLVGSPVTLMAQHASINLTLNGKLISFSYQDPHSICSVPNAVRNTALLWGIFFALLLATIIGVQVWLHRKDRLARPRGFTVLTSMLHNQKIQFSKRMATSIWVFLSDVVWFIYSQVTDIITIHQVFGSGHKGYAFTLLAILLLPYVLIFLLVVRVCVKYTQSKVHDARRGGGTCRVWVHRCIAAVVGFVLSPFLFLALEALMMLQAFGLSGPTWILPASCDLSSLYRIKSIAESFSNALPQAVIQTKLYIMGNNPNGIHVYINTSLFLASVVGSLISVLKTVALLIIEVRQFGCGIGEFLKKLIDLAPVENAADLQNQPPPTAQLLPDRSMSDQTV